MPNRYRVTSVGETGTATTKLFKNAAEAQRIFEHVSSLKHVIFAVQLVDELDAGVWYIQQQYVKGDVP